MAETGDVPAERKDYCTACGNQAEHGAFFCMHCGGAVRMRLDFQSKWHQLGTGLRPAVGGLLIILGAFFNILTAWYINDIPARDESYILIHSEYLSLAFALLIGFLGFVAGIGGIAALLRREYALAFIGGVSSCFSIGIVVGLAGLLMVATSKDAFFQL